MSVYGLPSVPVAYSICYDVEIKPVRADVLFEVRSAVASVRKSTAVLSAYDDPVVSRYRAFIGEIGCEQSSRIKISSEELLKKALSTGRIPSHNIVVDLVNVASLLTRIPMCVVDFDRVVPPLKLTHLARELLVRDFKGRELRIPRGAIVLEDRVGRAVYVYPHGVTDVASVTLSTRSVIIASCGAPGVPSSLVVLSVRLVKKYVENYIRGAECTNPDLSKIT